MDFIIVLNLILKSFAEEDIQYALIGGFAMGTWGIMRSTVELLMERFGEKLNWELIGGYFKLFKKEERYEKLKKEYSKTE